jgi:hypothetical protein
LGEITANESREKSLRNHGSSVTGVGSTRKMSLSDDPGRPHRRVMNDRVDEECHREAEHHPKVG